MTGTVGLGRAMGKKRNDKSAKVDSWVLFMVETIVNWRRQTREEDEKLTVAEYISETVRKHATSEYELAVAWMSQNKGGEAPKAKKKKPDAG